MINLNRGVSMALAALWGISTQAAAPTPQTDAAQLTKSLDNSAPQFLSAQRPQLHSRETKVDSLPTDGPRMMIHQVRLDKEPIQNPAIEAIVKPSIGQSLSLAEIQALATKITAYYREEGFLLNRVVVPTQDGKEGSLDLHMIRGYIDDIDVQGDKWLMDGRVGDYIQRIKEAHPLTNDVYERNILLLDDLPGVEVKATLTRSKNNPEASTLVVMLKQKVATLSVGVNDDGTKTIGPWQTQASAQVNNLMHLNEAVSFGVSWVPHKNGMKVFNLGWTQPLGTHGWIMNVTGSTARTHPSGSQAFLRNYGETDSYGVSFMYPLIRKKFSSLRTTLAFNSSDIKNDTRLFTNKKTNDCLRIFSAALQYDFSDSFRGQNILSVTLSKGVNGLGATKQSSLTKSRNTGQIDFVKANFLFIRSQLLPWNFQLQGTIKGQWSANSLVSSQRMSIGGPPYNRTYPNATFSGDNGIEYKLELSYPLSDVPLVTNLVPYTYFAHGAVWNKALGAGEKKKQSLNGMAIGVRSTVIENLNTFVEYSFPFQKSIQGTQYNNKTYVGVSYNMSF